MKALKLLRQGHFVGPLLLLVTQPNDELIEPIFEEAQEGKAVVMVHKHPLRPEGYSF